VLQWEQMNKIIECVPNFSEAAKKPTPGGGAVSAIAGALAASLIEMVGDD